MENSNELLMKILEDLIFKQEQILKRLRERNEDSQKFINKLSSSLRA